MKIGFIGIGLMGQHMSRHILEAGYDLTVNDLRRVATEALIKKGARWADTPREIAQYCDMVFLSLPKPSDVEQVVYGKNGLKYGWKSGDILVDMSTNSPSSIRRIAQDAQAMGVSVLDAPVSGATTGAEMGTLTIMVGGEEKVFEKIHEILKTMGKSIFLVGDVGCGNIAKLVNNLISLTASSIIAEGFVLGVKAGIDPQVLWNIVSVSTGQCRSLEQIPNTTFKANFEPGFKISLGRKDLGLALDLGKEVGVPLSIGSIVLQGLDAAIEAGYSEKSIQSVILPLEDKTGVRVRTSKSG
jgi:3-hydroxyisobutyrate dehydrogenase-like beta-hydroxyacid dehydrogenase